MRNGGVLFSFVTLLGLAASCSSGDGGGTPQATGGASSTAGAPGTAGQQAQMCGAGLANCNGTCVNTFSNFSNCGGCGKACAQGQMCSNGMCTCVDPLSACGASCVNLKSDGNNCGACNTTCGAQVCSQSKCSDTCAQNELQCANSCVDSQNDPTNCGACNNVCGPSQICRNGGCECTTGTRCAAQCVDINNNTQHCGACGKACGMGQTCISGVCMGTIIGGGGTGGTGAGGAAGMSGGGGTMGGASGAPPTGGSGGGTVTPPAGRTCPVTEGLIADFEEGKADVLAIEGRAGLFEGYGDAAGAQMAKVETEGTTMCNSGVFHAKGSGFAEYVGVAAVLKGTLDTAKSEYVPAKYDASAYTGISFRAKKGAGNANPIRFGVATPWTEGAPYGDGTCSDTDNANKCWNHLGHFLIDDEELTDQWKTFTFCFDRDFYPLFLPNGVSTENRRAISANLLKLQFQFNQSFNPQTAMLVARNAAFDFYLDDVKFVKTPCEDKIFQSSANTADKFGTNANVGTCMPVTDAAKFNKAISEAYARWKVKFVNDAGAVYSPEQNNKIISEGIGYGMLITAAMGDQAMFDKIWGWAKPKLSDGLLGWDNGVGGSATDADTDMGYALLMAGKQWGGEYASLGMTLIGKAKLRDVDGSNYLLAGCCWGGDPRFNPSYFSPGFYRAFGSDWNAVITTNYVLLDTCDQRFGSSDGIVPDWCDRSGAAMSPSGAQVTSGSLCPDKQACYTYDASRTPWRIGYDVCTGGTAGKAYIDRLITKIAEMHMGGARIDLMKAGYDANGMPLKDAVDNEMAFIGPIGVAAMASTNTAMRDRAFRIVLDIIERPEYYKTYYSTTLGLLTLLMMTGNWPGP
jgi:endo-1,4-beta-D-glucanase Y